MNKPVIMIVDNLESFLILIKKYCSNIEANVVVFTNPKEAFEYAKINICDIAIIDYTMPDMDGIELTKKLKKLMPDIFIIMVTESTISPELKLEVLENGASEFLNKPLYMAEFAARIKNALEIVKSRNRLKDRVVEEVIKSEKKLKTLFEILPVGIALIDDMGTLVEINPELEKILSYSKAELLDKNYKQLTFFDVDGNELTIEQITDILMQTKDRTIKDFEIEIKKDSGNIWVNISAALMSINGYGNVITVTNITKQKKLEIELFHAKEAAEAANKAKINFIANTSYKMITPLSYICEHTDSLYEKKLEEEIHEIIKTMKRESVNLMEMINNVLDYSRIEADVITENKSNVNFYRILKYLEKIYRKFAEEKNLSFIVTIDDSLYENINLDEVKITKIFKILISNAIKFTHKGYVEINALREIKNNSEYLVFVVKDTGIGISKNKIQNLYGIFEQDEYFLTKCYAGIGIGLAVAKRMVDLLHGTIDISSYTPSDSVGFLENMSKALSPSGTIVTVKIPLDKTEDSSQLPDNSDINFIKKEINILIAEDNETTIYLLKKFLSQVSKQVSVAVNEKEIMENIREKKYDLILMNICTPEIKALETTRIFRNEGLDIPIIAIAPYNSIEKMKEALEAGMNDYISKPFDFETLINTIKRVL